MTTMKKIFKIIGLILLALVLLVGGLLAFLTATEYRPKERSAADSDIPDDAPALSKSTLSILTWNIGYAGLDADEDFFMDGGSMVNPIDQSHVDNNLTAIGKYLSSADADICLLQEVDRDSARSGNIDELSALSESTGLGWTYAANYRCKFVPYPLPPIGKMDAGIATLSDYKISENAERISLPCPFSWPVRTANLKRCLLISRFPVDNEGHELVAVNLHLEAYDNGEGKAAQTKMLLNVLESEYKKGNYVVAGGDFNQVFPDSLNTYPIKNPDLWTPGVLNPDDLPDGWQFAYDTDTPSCRLLNQAYDPESEDTQHYVIDGFIVSPNVEIKAVKTADLGFANSDHNPVQLTVELK